MRPYRLMGIINVTPDSFSDGGLFLEPGAAAAHGLELVAQGADILDVGGESTRPGAEPVAVEEELRRVIPTIEALAQGAGDAQISVDTSKVAVAAAALDAGASFVNDVTALRGDPEMAAVVADSGADCCLMHMLGEPRTMQRGVGEVGGVGGPQYKDVVEEVKAFLAERMAFAVAEGIAEERILLDPGIGFGKTVEHNLELLRRLGELAALGRPVVIGTSRKSFLGMGDRLPGTIATNVMAFERGARVFRVHDVAPVGAALASATATLGATWTASEAMT